MGKDWRTITTALATTALFLYCGYRAFALSLVHDEAISYSIATSAGSSLWAYTTNNHILNSFLMGLSIKVFGDSEIALRLPNIIAFIAYMAFTILILSRVSSVTARVIGFTTMLINPFLLDFFSIARGYGLALSFTTAGIYFLMRTRESLETPPRSTGLPNPAVNNLVLSFCMAWMATISMFGFLYFYTAIAATTITVLTNYHRKKYAPVTRRDIETYTILGIMNAAFIGVVALRLKSMYQYAPQHGLDLTQQYTTAVGPWQHTGFVQSTVRSLADSTLYGAAYSNTASVIIVRLVMALTALAIYAAIRPSFEGKAKTNLYMAIALLALCIAQPSALHTTAAIPYPIERTALMYIPLFAITTAFAVDALVSTSAKAILKISIHALMIATAAAAILHFGKTATLHYTYTWKYDANTNEALKSIDRVRQYQPSAKIALGTTIKFEPSINYYISTKYKNWLLPVTRQGISDPDMDFYYCGYSDKQRIPPGNLYVVREFPDTNTVLYKKEPKTQLTGNQHDQSTKQNPQAINAAK